MIIKDSASRPRVIITSFDEDDVIDYMKTIEEIEDSYPASQVIMVQIDSYGGSVHGLSLLYDKLKSMRNPILTYTSSKAMSAGAILLSTVASKGKRVASPEATIMVHEIQAGAMGDIKDIEDTVNYLRIENNKWMRIMAKSMNMSSAADLRKLIKKQAIGHDIYLSAHDAKKLNIVDHVGTISMEPYSGWQIKVGAFQIK